MTKVNENSQTSLNLSMPVQYLKGVGPARARIFAELGVETVSDLLEYFPRDWVFAPKAVKINHLQANETATIIGLVESTDYQNYRKPPMFEAMLSDDTGVCRIVWFHGGYLRDQLQPGQIIIASGKISSYKHRLQMTNPKFLLVDEKTSNPDEHFSGAVYPASAKLGSRQIRKIIMPVLDNLDALRSQLSGL